MIAVDQTRFGQEGNCWAACIASLLELGIDDVPTGGQLGQGPDHLFSGWATDHGFVYLEVPMLSDTCCRWTRAACVRWAGMNQEAFGERTWLRLRQC